MNQKRLEVESITLKGPDGKIRGHVETYKDGVTLSLNRVTAGRPHVGLDIAVNDEDGPKIILFGPERGEIRFEFDEHGNPCITLAKGNQEQTFSLGNRDKKGGA